MSAIIKNQERQIMIIFNICRTGGGVFRQVFVKYPVSQRNGAAPQLRAATRMESFSLALLSIFELVQKSTGRAARGGIFSSNQIILLGRTFFVNYC
jgi:hypothetical protein